MKSRLIRYLDLAGLAILVITAIGGLLWITVNSTGYQRQLQQENDMMTKEIEGLKLAETNLKSLGAARDRVQDGAATLYRRIPPRIEMGALVRNLHARTKERRIALTSLQPQAAVSEELYTKIPIRMVFHGGFEQIYRFFRDIEAMDQLLIPEKITISGSDADSESVRKGCQVEMTLLAFERKNTGAVKQR